MPTLPNSPRITYTPPLVALLDDTNAELHRLGGTARLVPEAPLLGAAAVRASALACGSLEGDAADHLDLLRLEVGDTEDMTPGRLAAARRAHDRAEALRSGLERLARGAPLDGELLVAVRGRLPGAPLEGERVASRPSARLSSLSRLLGDGSLPLLVRVALAQRRLGLPTRRGGADRRLGPLLCHLALAHAGVLPVPLLRFPAHVAAGAEDHRELIERPEPEPWVRTFLEGVVAQARADGRWVQHVRHVQLAMRDRLEAARAAPAVVATASRLVARPYLSANALADDLGVSGPTARSAIDQLVEHGQLIETTSRRRDRYYAAPALLAAVAGAGHPAPDLSGNRAGPVTDGSARPTSWSLGGDSNP